MSSWNDYPEDPPGHDQNWLWAGHNAKIWMRQTFFRALGWKNA